jgi:D-alanine--poly(phosphoribitol) ligase subunit 2
MNTKEVILELVRELAENNDITLDQGLLDEGIIDSLTTIELIGKLESQFNITIDTDELNHHNFNTVLNIISLVDKKLSN